MKKMYFSKQPQGHTSGGKLIISCFPLVGVIVAVGMGVGISRAMFSPKMKWGGCTADTRNQGTTGLQEACVSVPRAWHLEHVGRSLRGSTRAKSIGAAQQVSRGGH